ncbi:MAG: hypothetical protein AB7L84_06025 [Acidimicrobiia bacterium]
MVALTALVASVAGAISPGATAGAAPAQSVERQPVAIVDEAGESLDGGGSTTPFTFDLPDGAACPGDSADDNYRVDGYMVAADVDPATVEFDGLGPTPVAYGGDHAAFRMTLYETGSASFASALTDDAEEPGDPGVILGLPHFSFEVYAPGDVPPGRYKVGIACTLVRKVSTLWENEIEVTVAADDQPAQIRWQVLGNDLAAEAGGDGGSSSRLPLVLGLAAVVLLGVAFVARRGSSSRTPSATKEIR